MVQSLVVSMQDPLRVLAADSTSMSTQLLVEALAREASFKMIESAPTPAGILTLVMGEKPHVAVISAKLGEKDTAGFEAARAIRAQCPDTRMIMLLDTSERTSVTEAFRAGAQGIFCRTEPFRSLAKCIHCVHLGQVWASSRELQFILEALAQPTFANFPGIGGSLLSATHQSADCASAVAHRTHGQELSVPHLRQTRRLKPRGSAAACSGQSKYSSSGGSSFSARTIPVHAPSGQGIICCGTNQDPQDRNVSLYLCSRFEPSGSDLIAAI
jgi:DNA-binding NarL/FixJ family response regulator